MVKTKSKGRDTKVIFAVRNARVLSLLCFNIIAATYFVPRLRHLRWPGTNLVPLAMRIEPIVLAGDRFRQPSAGVTDSTLNDSLELHDDELGPDGEAGSRLSERLQ